MKRSVFVKTKDYRLSQEDFDLLLDERLDLLQTNPVPKDLPKYYHTKDYISHTDSAKTLFDVAYQFIKYFAIKKKLKWVEKHRNTGVICWNDEAMKKGDILKGSSDKSSFLLDVGSGTGSFAIEAKNLGYRVCAVEPNNRAREVLKCKDPSIVPFQSLEQLIESNFLQKFEVITLWHVLEHMPNLEEVIFQLKTLLKPDGVLFIAVPNYKSYDAIHYGKYWAAYDVPRHLWHFSQTAIRRLFFLQGMEVAKNHSYEMGCVLCLYFE